VTKTGPIGETAEAATRRRVRGAAYRREQERLAPYEALARLVIKHRLEQGLTQQQLADRMGTSHSAISRIESGQHPTSLRTMQRVAEALGGHLVVGFEVAGDSGRASCELVAIA
jgi:ribosome-binding protein aMBF1 (putative translation factor)